MGRILLFCILAIVSTWTWGKEDTVNTSSDIQAYISYCSFMAPGQGPYLEVYYTVNSNSITYKRKENGQLQGRLSVTYMLLHQDTVYKYDKFRIHTPAVDSLQNIDFSIVDQRRTSVQPGRYRLRVRITDSYDTSNTTYVDMPVHVNYSNDTVEISDIELVDRYQESKANSRFTKNNYDIYPLVANFLPTQRKQLTFYAEIYNTDKIFSADKQFLVRYSIKESNSDKVVDRLSQFNKKSPSPVNVLFANLDISTLSTGNYELCVQVRNRKNKKVAEKRLFFQRVNRKMRDSVKKELKHVDVEDTFVDTITGDDMDYHLNAIYPIADKREMGVIKSLLQYEESDQKKQQFFWNFWRKRDSVAPDRAYHSYMLEVRKVNKAFGTQISYGFETDRGRVYLEYGPPNDRVTERGSPSGNPYEIWYYYDFPASEQSEVKFVFHNPSLATNDYQLIHSNARGEINNRRWKHEVYSSFKERNNFHNLDNNNVRDHYGSKLNDYFRE